MPLHTSIAARASSAWLQRTLGAALLSLGLAAAPAHALSISVVPSTTSAESGAAVSMSIVVDGLDAANEIVGAFDLDLVYDATLFDFGAATFGSAFGDPSLRFEDAIASPGRIDLFLLTFLFDDELAALQGDSVTLATLGFVARAPGSGTFALDPQAAPGIAVNGYDAALLAFDAVNAATVRVTPPVNVPEPSSALLAALGLFGVLGARAARRRG